VSDNVPQIAKVSIIEHLVSRGTVQGVFMKVEKDQPLAVRCPTCGAKRGEKCELSTGLPRINPHRDRRLLSAEQ
jgi:hypothetical protein